MRDSIRAFVSLFFLCTALPALAAGRLDGRVTAGDRQAALEGARVTIPALNRSVSSGRDGRFSFGQLPAGNYEITVEYLGAPPASRQVEVVDGQIETIVVALGATLEEVIVFGARAGVASALNQQRNADTIVSVVSSDSIGQLPDANVAEAVQRVPGVFLERDQGEGRYIGIRGIDPNLNVTTINGMFVPAPDAGARSVALDVIPSDLVEGLEISKTFTPDMDGSAIGGTVNVRSLSAFDRTGRSLSVTAEASYNDLVSETSPKIAAAWSDVFGLGDGEENFGVALALSWFDRELGSDNIETDGGWPDDLETVDGAVFRGAEEIEQRSYTINRERLGVALNFDFHGRNGNYYWRNLYSDFSDQEYRTRNEWKFDDGEAVSGSGTAADWSGATLAKEMKDRLETQEILSILLGGENVLDAWTLDYNYGYSESTEEEPDRLDTVFEAEDLDLGYTSTGPVPTLVGEDAAFDVARFAGDEFVYLDGLAEDTAHAAKLNITRELFSESYNGDIKFGVHYRRREKTYDVDEFVYEAPDDLRLALLQGPSPRYGLGRFGPGISAGAARDYFFANRGELELDEEDTLVASVAGDFVMNEDVAAAYLMSTVDLGAWRIVYGVRYEDTDFDATGQRIIIDDVAGTGDPEARPTAFARDQDHWLPGVNVRYEQNDIVFRAAATQTLARPNFGELSPGGEVVFESDDGENVLEAELGNPLLDIVESTNLDVGVEWYPGGVSLLSAGVFYKRLKNFIYIADVADSIDLSAIVGDLPVDDAEVIQPVNGETADLYGLELAAVHQYDNGLYVSANGTWVKTEARFPAREQKGDLPRTPELVLNGAVGWENDAYSLRLAATYRDDALQALDDLEDPAFDIYQDAHLQVDFSARWNFNPTWQLAFTANNLTDEPFYNYFGSRPYNAQYEEYGTTYSLALRWTPF